MAFMCIESCFNKRLYEEGVIYDSIGVAAKKFFKEVKDQDEGVQVVETGEEEEEVEIPATETSPAPVKDDSEAKAKEQERTEIKEALTELDVKFNKRASTDKLKKLLLDAQSSALTS